MSTTNDATKVTTGKPKISGAVFSAPRTATVPTDATTALDEAFTCLGHVSEDGTENENSLDFSEIKAWGGAIVYRSLNEFQDNFKMTLIEAENPDVLKAVYGDERVTVDEDTGAVTVEVAGDDPQEKIWVIELALRGSKKKRIVIPDGAVTERESITYNDSDAVGYGITIAAYPDDEGVTHKEYMA